MKKCPYCAEEIQDEAIICRFCGRDLAGPNPIKVNPPPQPVEAKPAKKSSTAVGLTVLILILVCVCLVAVYAFRTPSTGTAPGVTNPTSADILPILNPNHQVVYELVGTFHTAGVTYANDQGGTEQGTYPVGWRKTYSMQYGDFLYLSAQNEGDSGTITCKIWVDGRVFKTSTSQGAYVIASCSGRLGE